jgi:hypothetical protein
MTSRSYTVIRNDRPGWKRYVLDVIYRVRSGIRRWRFQTSAPTPEAAQADVLHFVLGTRGRHLDMVRLRSPSPR